MERVFERKRITGLWKFGIVCSLWCGALCTSAAADQAPLVVSTSSLSPAVKGALTPKAPEPPKPPVEIELGELHLESVTDQDFAAADYNQKKVVIYFWSVYCRSCVGALDQLESMRSDLEKQNVELLTVHLFESRKDRINEAIAKFGVNLPIVMAPKAVRDLFSIRILPTTLVFNEDHRLVGRLEGAFDEEGLRLRLFRKVEEPVAKSTSLAK